MDVEEVVGREDGTSAVEKGGLAEELESAVEYSIEVDGCHGRESWC